MKRWPIYYKMQKNPPSFSQPFSDVKQVPTAGERSLRSTVSTQEFIPGATDRVSETVCLKAAGTLLIFGLWTQVEAKEAMEAEVHNHWNNSSTGSKSTGSSWSTPLHCPTVIIHLLVAAPWDTPKSTPCSSHLSMIFFPCFSLPFAICSGLSLHDTASKPTSQLPPCSPSSFLPLVMSKGIMGFGWSEATQG